MPKPSILIVVGPTAAGKSELAVKLAKKFNGEVISADSRQIYRGLDIGSGKIEGQWQNKIFLYKNIPHYLIDEANPRVQYSVARFQKNARKAIADILSRGKLPIICGGTAHWVDAVVFEQSLPDVKPNTQLRTKLTKLTPAQLFTKLKKLDPARAKTIDAKNPRRLIRALEIIMTTGQAVPKVTTKSPYNPIWIGVNPGIKKLETNIQKRLQARLKQGMIKEVSNLHKQGLSWKKLESLGLEYKFCALYLQQKLSKTDMELLLYRAIRQYAKRQLTWWKRNEAIQWSETPEKLLSIAKKTIS